MKNDPEAFIPPAPITADDVENQIQSGTFKEEPKQEFERLRTNEFYKNMSPEDMEILTKPSIFRRNRSET